MSKIDKDTQTATEILSKIFDKDGIKYKKTDDHIKIESSDCSISIQESDIGYRIDSKCNTETDKEVRSLFGNLKLINKFDITRITPDQLFIKGVESPMGKDVGSISFTLATKREIRHLQTSRINCTYNDCKLTNGEGWEY